MKLSFFSAATLIAIGANGQTSQPECYNWTQSQLYETNADLQPAEDAYFATVSSFLEANCINADDSLKECDFEMDDESSESKKYIEECTSEGGNIWSYTYSPKCDNAIEQTVEEVLVCASSDCVDIGVQNLIPDSSFLDPFVARNYTCGTGTNDLELEVKGGSAGAKSGTVVVALAVSTIVGVAVSMF